MINILYLNYNHKAPCNGYWDMAFLNDTFEGIYNYNFEIKEARSIPKHLKFAVIVLPARSQIDYVNVLNREIQNLEGVLLFVVGDEESLYPIEKIKHDNIKIYTMSYKKDNTEAFINGYPPQIHKYLNKKVPEKSIAWFFSGQITHSQREKCANVLKQRDDGELVETSGFTKGLSHPEYYALLKKSAVAPCPGGPCTPDTFRLYESLEMACTPIIDYKQEKNYWHELLGHNEIPTLDNYSQLNGYIDDCINNYPVRNNDIFSWWIRYKRDFKNKIINDIANLSMIVPKNKDITIIVPVSPIKSHPSIKILDETIKSIRHHFPTEEIILTFDGIRKEQQEKTIDYNEFIRRILWKCNTEYKNVYPLIFKEHSHQTGMAKQALEYVNTDLILYCEQDTPLVLDYEIPFEKLSKIIRLGISNMIRLHFEASIPKEHMHMMHGIEKGYELTRTSQWSQRPHIVSKAFYKRVLTDYFTENAKSFIEDKMHSVLWSAYVDYKTLGWNQFKVHIYTPEGNIKRSYHTDGRENEKKYDESQVF